MKYYTLTKPDVMTILDSPVSEGESLIRDRETEIGSGEGSVDAVAERAVEAIQPILPDVDEDITAAHERAMMVPIHMALPIEREIAADDGFWRWLQVKYFRDIIERRHGKLGLPANPANFGVGSVVDGMIARVWFRAEIVYAQGLEDPYYLAKYGDQDFWRSHILRQRYSCNRVLARALVKFQYNTNEGGVRLHTSKPNGIRSLVKRVRRSHVTWALDFMDEQQLLALLETLSGGLS